MKIILKAIILFITVNIVGLFVWPYASYLTGCDIGILCYLVSASTAIIGLILLIISFIKKQSKEKALWVIITSFALYSCCFVTIYNKYGENGHFVGEYIEISKYDENRWPNIYGLANKFGHEFIEPKYDWIMKVFINDKKSYIYIGVESHMVKKDSIVDGNSINFYTHVLYLYDEDGKLQEIENIIESDCDNVKDYVNKHIGKITDKYGYGYVYHDRMIRTVY